MAQDPGKERQWVPDHAVNSKGFILLIVILRIVGNP